MKVCALLVTYADRFKLLEQVIHSLLKLDIFHIIIVDNNSSQSTKDSLAFLKKRFQGMITVISLEQNIGSAGGYAKGLKRFYDDNTCDVVWLLDDDNLPMNNALSILVDFWGNLKEENKEQRIALLSYRVNRKIYKEAIQTNNPDLVVGKRNGFIGFHVYFAFQKLLKRITNKNHNQSNFGLISASYYGGLFFHKKLLDNIGFPNEEFFVYSDDIEFSARINNSNGKIYLLLESEISDIEISPHQNVVRESVLNLPLFNTINKFVLYYSIRNRIYFENHHWINNRFIYSINKIIYLSLLKMIFLVKPNSFNTSVINSAIKDGLQGKLGKRDAALLNP